MDPGTVVISVWPDRSQLKKRKCS